jgi:hypothetical protein
MRFLLLINGLIVLNFSTFVVADNGLGSFADDCFQEWKMRGWTIGEDNTPAADFAPFVDGIKRICKLRSELYAADQSISPYIEGRMAEVAPYVFSVDEASIKHYILKLKERRPGFAYSGTFLTD